MATARETIQTGLEALRVVGFGQSPTSAQAQYCLKQLNAYIRSIKGFGGSLPLQTVAAAQIGSQVSTRWPAVRVLCQGGETITLPDPRLCVVPDGMRVEIVDAALAAASSNIVIARNGGLIDGAASNYTISTNGGDVSLMWRADAGNWQVMEDLGLDDELPFPTDFDEAIALNAADRYTRFGQALSDRDAARAKAGASRIRARYAKPPAAQFDAAVSSIGGASGPYASLNDFLNGVE